MSKHIVVIGAGVIGLTTALKILESSTPSDTYTVSIVAEHLPGDVHAQYASCWAGAHVVSIVTDEPQRTYEKETYAEMRRMVQDEPEGWPISLLEHFDYGDFEEGEVEGNEGMAWSGDYRMTEPEVIPKEKLPPYARKGVKFQTLHIDTPAYLQSLLALIASLGGTLTRSRLTHLSDAVHHSPSSSPPAAIVNCTGLGSYSLSGVSDTTMFPIRGDTVLVRAPDVKRSVNLLSSEEVSYVIPRGASGLVVLGGTKIKRDWDTQVRDDTVQKIKERCIRLVPELLPEGKRETGRAEDLDVVHVGVGLRPAREANIRIEKEVVHVDGRDIPVIHHYGHGGFGYQSSLGSTKVAVALLRQVLGSK